MTAQARGILAADFMHVDTVLRQRIPRLDRHRAGHPPLDPCGDIDGVAGLAQRRSLRTPAALAA
jgi:hypothetical protein